MLIINLAISQQLFTFSYLSHLTVHQAVLGRCRPFKLALLPGPVPLRQELKADGLGFEPRVPSRVQQFSRLPPSTTRPPIQIMFYRPHQGFLHYGTENLPLLAQ